MSTHQPTPTTSDPLLTKAEAHALELEAKRYHRKLVSDTYAFCTVLYKLHAGDAHILRGFPNFADYAESKFDDLSGEYAKKMSRVGAISSMPIKAY